MQHRKQIRLPIALIAIAILPALAHAQADTPARPTITVLPKADLDVNQWKETQFVAFDPHFKKEMPKRIARAHVLGAQVIMRELTGQKTTLSHQILSETIWLISSTADFKQIDERFDDLQATLDHPEREAQGAQQNSDGSSGAGYTQWFFQLIASYSHLNDPNAKYDFIDRINSPQKLTDYFVSISVSDIPRTGIDHEREFNESMSYLMRMILRQKPKAYHYDPKLKETLMDLLLHRFRNPTTGYWGESYVREGRVEFVDDLSMTFHIVSYLDGDVSDMDKVVATTLAIVDLEFPVGPVYKGERFDHLNMDVVELFRLGWPHASAEQKTAIAAELKKMLHWCLTDSLQPDGSFKFWIGDNSMEESTYYGTSFLARLGYFDKSKRFWTDEEFPDAEQVRQKIIQYIQDHSGSGGASGEYFSSALEQLGVKGQ